MTIRKKFNQLKSLDFSSLRASLAIVRIYNIHRKFQYNIEYVEIEKKLKARLLKIVENKINKANSFEEYSYDCPEPEGDLVRTIKYESTDFYNIMTSLKDLNPEESKVNSVEDLVKAKSYIIVVRNNGKIQVAGFKSIPENWKLKKSKGLIPLLFENKIFKDLETDNVFSISNSLDFIFFNDLLFILSKKGFEKGMNFRKGMLAKADEWYQEIEQLNLFFNIDTLKKRVGDNQRYLRKIATIKNLGYYRDQKYLNNLRQVNQKKNWGIKFDRDGTIEITEENLDDILTIMQNKRLHSELTKEDFDVESVKKLK